MDNWIAPKINTLPDFIIGGAMKCGTTSLHTILNNHPDIYVPPGEIGFFDIDNILQHSDYSFYKDKNWFYQSMDKNPKELWEWYYNKFKDSRGLLVGEDSTTYLASKIAAKRIAKQEKKIKMIFILRQPSLRAYSNYWHLVRTGRVTETFENTLLHNPFQIINRSLYKEQLEYYYSLFPVSNIKVVLFEDLIKNFNEVTAEVCGFLGVDFNKIPKTYLEKHSNKSRMPKNYKLQLYKNSILRNYGNLHYLDQLPISYNVKAKPIPIIKKILNKIHKKVNPNIPESPPKINTETKQYLDQYFYNQLQGIDELLEKDVLKIWFPKIK
ncbi:sulfotransferase [Patiriisocius marinus]|uniref:Sulfotransferase n=1 Tax=Patiriisocius marinus TaxID=1397112 RepID=A0A5J4IYX0_9FLAO|nr:sulfotransferase [Patiriisocius marinus]GER59692.1 sulfotransferase [Patiriisocius marinus]